MRSPTYCTCIVGQMIWNETYNYCCSTSNNNKWPDFLKFSLYIIYNAHIYLHALYKLRIFTLIFRSDLFKIISQFSLGYCCCYHSKTSIAIIEHVIKNNQVCKLLNDGKQVITEFCYVLSKNLCFYFEYWSYNKQFTFRNNKTKIS